MDDLSGMSQEEAAAEVKRLVREHCEEVGCSCRPLIEISPVGIMVDMTEDTAELSEVGALRITHHDNCISLRRN
jgi:hypothetical protein